MATWWAKSVIVLAALGQCAVGLGCGGTTPEHDENLDEPPVVASTTQALHDVAPVGTAPAQLGKVSYDATNAYFTYPEVANCTTPALVTKMRLSSGARTTLSSGNCVNARKSSSNGTTLYYLDVKNRDVRRVPVGGGADTKFMDTYSLLTEGGIYAGPNYVIWGDDVGLYIGTAQNQKALLVESPTGQPVDFLGTDGQWWYFQVCRSGGCNVGYELWRAAFQVPPELMMVQLAFWGSQPDENDFRPFTFDSTHVYWAARINTQGQQRVRQLQKSDLTIGSLRTTSAKIWSIAANEGYVFWTENQNPQGANQIWRYSKSSHQAAWVVSPAPAANDLHVTETQLYWTENYSLNLWRAGLP